LHKTYVSEAIAAGLPIILYSYLPGQEEGNVTYVVNKGVGVWAPEPTQILETVIQWVNYPEEREKIAVNCRNLAIPDASHQIAKAIVERLNFAIEVRNKDIRL